MPGALTPVITACTQWLTDAYAVPGAWAVAHAQAQARQAATVAAWLRYPTVIDAELVAMTGPGGSERLDWAIGTDTVEPAADQPWRSWVDEVVTSWAACLLADPALARAATVAVRGCDHTAGLEWEFRRLTSPDDSDGRAGALLRHPDLLAPVAALHRDALLDRLQADPVNA